MSRSSNDEIERKERRIEQLEQISADLRCRMEAAHRTADQIQQSSQLKLSEIEMETAKQLAAVRRERENAFKVGGKTTNRDACNYNIFFLIKIFIYFRKKLSKSICTLI